MAHLPSARSISEIIASADGESVSETSSASFLASETSPILRLMRAVVSFRPSSSNSEPRFPRMSLLSRSGKSMNMNLHDFASFWASLFLLARNRWYSFSLGSHLRSRHQSAAALCHLRRVSTSAFSRYHVLVSCFMWTVPLASKGIR